MKAAGVSNLALRCLNTLGGQQELLGSLNRLLCAIQLFEAQVLSPLPQVSAPSAESEAVRSVVSRLEASVEVVFRHFYYLRRLLL